MLNVGDNGAAEALFKQAIDADSNNLDAYGLLAGLYLREQRLDEASQPLQHRLVGRVALGVPSGTAS